MSWNGRNLMAFARGVKVHVPDSARTATAGRWMTSKRERLRRDPPARGPSPWRYAPVPPPKQPGGGTKARFARGYSAHALSSEQRAGRMHPDHTAAVEQPLPVRERWTA